MPRRQGEGTAQPQLIACCVLDRHDNTDVMKVSQVAETAGTVAEPEELAVLGVGDVEYEGGEVGEDAIKVVNLNIESM
jgi:hypothetical protein